MRIQRPLHLLLSLVFLAAAFSAATVVENGGTTSSDDNTDFIRTSCNTTLYPKVCYSSLSRHANAVQQNPGQLARVAIAVSLLKVQSAASYLSNLTLKAGNSPAAKEVHDCFSKLDDAVDQIRDSLKQMRQIGSSGVGAGDGTSSFRFQMSNVLTWMSAAITNEGTCMDGLNDVSEGPVKTDVSRRVTKVKKITSNALALANSYSNKGMP
ncbi:21 kDa protein-like [Gastrolobium bilobum]|uniref:21 kDa protein-like n=1 Tax=Gastrolobium bilobum TaxID=150636 RepID=UPI002AAF3EB4|nr:21 kDa protein-like [Gastrolobium bilobum]